MRNPTKTQKGKLRQECREKYGHVCAICGGVNRLTVHHIVPLSIGGDWELYNLILLDDRCHRFLHHTGSGDHLNHTQVQAIEKLRKFLK